MTTLEDLEVMLKRHDWHSEYSDDYRSWKAGWEDSLRIKAMMAELAAQGLGEAAAALYAKYKPEAT